MQSSIDSFAFIFGTLLLVGLAVVGLAAVGVLTSVGILALREDWRQLQTAQEIVRLEEERKKMEGMIR